MAGVINKRNTLRELFENFETIYNKGLKTTTFILSYGSSVDRCQVKEFYGRTLQKSWENLTNFYRSLTQNNEYSRIDLIVEETPVTYEALLEAIKEVPRNNYMDFGIRLEGFKKRCFLKEELTANALLVPEKEHRVGYNRPNLSFNFPNYKGYVQRKYNVTDHTMNFFSKSTIYLFKTKAFFVENEAIFELKDYRFGNQIREVEEENFQENLDLVIDEGAHYLLDQLQEDGQFIYGYFPCYDKTISGYNSVRHFSSLYALFEAGEHLADDTLIERGLAGLIWGFNNLSMEIDGFEFIKDQNGSQTEFKLGAQGLAILATAKYTEITKDTRFFEKMKSLTRTIEKHFIDGNGETIHVFDEELNIKEKFRIIYYDGEALFSMLRAYELMKDEEIFAICERLMTHFVDNNYEKYHDHWLSYAVNEFLKHDQKDEYYIFGMKNALNRIDFIEKRETAYPTMLELLVAAAKMMLKLEVYEGRQGIVSDEEFNKAKARIFDVMDYRTFHEMVTGTMFPEFAMYFKAPHKIKYGFFARHDRYRMRIDDAEHFLSGFINYRNLVF